MAGGFIHYLSESAIGRLADKLHQRLFAGMPWTTLAIIGGIWDFIDIVSRLVSWGTISIPFLAIPTQVVLTVLDVLLVFFGTALWGATGLLQAIELVVSPIPGIGYILDLIPVLTVCAFIVRAREKREARESGWRGDMMLVGPRNLFAERQIKEARMVTWAGEIIFLVLWWKFALVSILWFLVAGMLLPIVGTLLSGHVPVGVRQPLVIVVLAGAVLCFGMYYWAQKATIEGYREKAWLSLVEQEDSRVLSALRADEAGDSIAGSEFSGRVVEGAKKLGGSAFKGTGKHLKEHDFGVPIVNSGAKWLGCHLDPTGCEDPAKEGAGKEEDKIEESERKRGVEKPLSREEEVVRGLGLGKAQAYLYKSRHVLKEAEGLREASIAFWGWMLFWNIWLLLVAVSLLFEGAVPPESTTPPPSVEGEGDEDDDILRNLR